MIASVISALVAFAPASAGAGAARPPVALTAAPARVRFNGSAHADVRVTNSGSQGVVVDVSSAGFGLDLRGRPRILPRGGARSAAPWLAFSPTRFALAPRSSRSIVLDSHVPGRAEPGDHDALVVFTTRPVGTGHVAVRVRMGVAVMVRVPGTIVRRLELRGLRVDRRRRALELMLANRGNVTESVGRPRAILSRGRKHVATLVAGRRTVRPRTNGIVEFRYRRGVEGRLTARIVIPPDSGRRRLARTYRIRL